MITMQHRHHNRHLHRERGYGAGFRRNFHINQFDVVFKQLERDMNMKMKKMNKITALITSNIDNNKVETQIVKVEEPKMIKKGYAECITILEQVLVDCGEIAKVIANKEWNKIFQLLIDLTNKVIQDVKCFKEVSKVELVKDYTLKFFNILKEDKQECVKRHLMEMYNDLKQAFKAALESDFKTAKDRVLDAYRVYQDVQNC